MKILIVNTSDIEGGAARAAYRLHKALLNEEIESLMLVQNKKSDDYTVISPSSKMEKFINLFRPTIDQIPVKFYKSRTKTLFSPAWFGFNNVIDKINKVNPDIVHLHWIAGGFLKIEDIAKIKQPVVWSLHDNWAFTGGCHIKWECEKYKESCGSCPRLGSNRENDLSRKVWKRKKNTYSSKKDIIIVGLSRWIANCAKESSLLKEFKIVNLPNPIDTSLYKPFDKKMARAILNINTDKKLIVFGAYGAVSDINKGFKELQQALKSLKRKEIELLVFGSSKPANSPDFGFKTYYLGHLYDDISLVILYNAVDVVVVPSLQENLSNTIMESLSCGTPVVAFNIGGNSDLIDHLKNGYLAKPFDPIDLANGIDWILNLNNEEYSKLSGNAREKILRNFDSKVVAKKYIELYEEILKNREKLV